MGMVLKLFSESSNELKNLFQNHPLGQQSCPVPPQGGTNRKWEGGREIGQKVSSRFRLDDYFSKTIYPKKLW